MVVLDEKEQPVEGRRYRQALRKGMGRASLWEPSATETQSRQSWLLLDSILHRDRARPSSAKHAVRILIEKKMSVSPVSYEVSTYTPPELPVSMYLPVYMRRHFFILEIRNCTAGNAELNQQQDFVGSWLDLPEVQHLSWDRNEADV